MTLSDETAKMSSGEFNILKISLFIHLLGYVVIKNLYFFALITTDELLKTTEEIKINNSSF